MEEFDDQEDRLLAYQSLPASSSSFPDPARGQLQGFGAGIIQRRYHTATDSELPETQSEGVGLKILSRSRLATSPLVNLAESSADSSGLLSKSVSFQSLPREFMTRFIDEAKIQRHQARSRSGVLQQQVLQTRQARRKVAYDAATRFAKAMYWVTIFTGLFGIALSGAVLFSATTSTWHRDFGKSPKFRHAAVASEQELCSKIGVGLLKRGGNAVDAAVATLFCIGVVNNFSSGIAGGGYLLIRVNATYSTVIDYRETAPSAVTEADFGRDGNKLIEGGLSVAVPAQVKGLATAHQKFGRLPWGDLLEPSIALCRQGFPVTPKLAKTIAQTASRIEKSPAMRDTYMKREVFLDSQEQVVDRWVPKTESDIIKRPDLGRTLEAVAAAPAAFWSGPIAEAIAAENQRAGGKLTAADIESYEPIEREPLVGTFNGFKVTTVASPASGAPLLLILRLLEGLRLSNATSIQERHLFIEALKFGYAARIHVADPAFCRDIRDVEESWLTDEHVATLLQKIDPAQTHPPAYYTDEFAEIKGFGTTHLCVMDVDETVVSGTDTVNHPFGACIQDGETGTVQNNEMGDFSLAGISNSYGLPPSEVNYVQAGKRPVSSATPIILERDGHVVLVTGAAGGSRIISATAQIIMDLLLFKIDPISAMLDSRIHHQLFPNEVSVDYETPQALIDGLIERGHKVTVELPDSSLTSLQLILRRQNGDIWALSDPRKGGLADGY